MFVTNGIVISQRVKLGSSINPWLLIEAIGVKNFLSFCICPTQNTRIHRDFSTKRSWNLTSVFTKSRLINDPVARIWRIIFHPFHSKQQVRRISRSGWYLQVSSNCRISAIERCEHLSVNDTHYYWMPSLTDKLRTQESRQQSAEWPHSQLEGWDFFGEKHSHTTRESITDLMHFWYARATVLPTTSAIWSICWWRTQASLGRYQHIGDNGNTERREFIKLMKNNVKLRTLYSEEAIVTHAPTKRKSSTVP